jgi:hypothetical protein
MSGFIPADIEHNLAWVHFLLLVEPEELLVQKIAIFLNYRYGYFLSQRLKSGAKPAEQATCLFSKTVYLAVLRTFFQTLMLFRRKDLSHATEYQVCRTC